MRFIPLTLAGAFEVELEPIEDERGFNARAWCAEDFAAVSLASRVQQVNIIRNHRAGTMRGMHWQVPPMAESKLFRVTRGAIFDVIVDLRADSASYGQSHGTVLRDSEYRMLVVPEGFAQGFQTLEDDTEITYQVTAPYSPAHGRGFRYDDPAFDIQWPLPVSAISEKDLTWAPFDDTMAMSLGRDIE